MRRTLLTLLTVLTLLTGCGEQAATELVVCSSFPLNDGTGARAQSMSRAVQQAIDEQNAAGGVTLAGQQFRLRHVPMDDTPPGVGQPDNAEDDGLDKWNAAQEELNARAAVGEHGCIAYIGTQNSGAAKIAMPILNRVQMAMISPANTYPGLSKPGTGIGDEPWIYSPLGPDQRNFCRVVPADDLQAPAAAQYAADDLEVTRVFVFHDTELYGRGVAEIFARAAEERGLEVVNDNGLPLGVGASTMDPNNLAATILATEPDLVYFGGIDGNKPGDVLFALRNQGYEGYFMGADAMATGRFIQDAAAGDDPRVFATLVGIPLEQLPAEGLDWQVRYSQTYNEAPDPFAAPAFESARVVIDSIGRAQVAEGPAPLLERARPAVLAAMKATRDFQGILGPWSFDVNCDTSDTTISINGVNDGAFQFLSVVKD